jgi:hypothetical protein
MSGIFDQIINYSPPLIVSGTVNYKGTWDASTNNPTLNNPPATSTKGDYYVVSTAGTQFSISFAVGDWIISSGTAWEKVDLTDAVSSVFGRTGAVVGVSTDYSSVGLTNTAIGASSPSTGAFTSLSSSSTTTLNGTTVPASKTLVVTTDKLSALAATTSSELAGVISDETGSGALVFATSPTLVTPILGTPSSGTLSSCTGLPISTGVSGLGTGIATALAINTGSAGAPVLFNGALGVPTSGTVTNLTGTASININGTVGATTPTTIAATTGTFSSHITLANARAIYGTTTGAVTGQILTLAGDNNVYVGAIDVGGDVIVRANAGATVGRFTSTGLNSTAIGATTASTGAFTTLSASGLTKIGTQTATLPADTTLWIEGGKTQRFGSSNYDADFGSYFKPSLSGSTTGQLTIGTRTSAVDTDILLISSTGLAVTGALSSTGNYNVSAGFKLTQNTNAFITPEDNTVGAVVSGTGAVHIKASGSSVGVFSSTGLAVTGTVSVDAAATNTTAFSINRSATDKNAIMKFQTAAADKWIWGMRNTSDDTMRLYSYAASGDILTVSSTGLAVTGALSTSGNFTISGASRGVLCNYTGATGSAFTNTDDTSNSQFVVFTNSNGTTCGSIQRVTTTNAIQVNLSSDRRLKHNVRDFTDSGALIDGLRPVRFDWNGDETNDDLKDAIGFVAQETHASSPVFARIGAVSVGDEDPDTVTKQWQRSDSALIPILVAELKALRQRVAALEA